MSYAALPTAVIAIEENKNGNIPPRSIPANVCGFATSKTFNFAAAIKPANNAKLVNAAEPIAKPFPTAAVVFPTASNLSVLSLTSFGKPAISAIPPALSAIGP